MHIIFFWTAAPQTGGASLPQSGWFRGARVSASLAELAPRLQAEPCCSELMTTPIRRTPSLPAAPALPLASMVTPRDLEQKVSSSPRAALRDRLRESVT